MTNLCQALHCLPRAGGLYDQDPYDVYRMSFVLEAQAERQAQDQKKQEAEAKAKAPKGVRPRGTRY